MTLDQRREFFRRFQARDPNPKTELLYSTPFELLIAVILSAQATDISVNKATRILFKVANTPTKMLALGEEKLLSYIKSIGLFGSKGKNILKTCQVLIDDYDSIVPDVREDLERLPGVGRKTANVILNTLFGQNTIAVDTHIFRVSNRTGLATGKTVRAVEDKLMEVIPKEYLKNAHHWLVLHGRYTCKARTPLCPTCIVSDLCEYPDKTGEISK